MPGPDEQQRRRQEQRAKRRRRVVPLLIAAVGIVTSVTSYWHGRDFWTAYLAVAAAMTVVCDLIGSSLIRDTRTYYPAYKVEKRLNILTYSFLAYTLLFDGASNDNRIRAIAYTFIFLRAAWSLWLIARRNITPIALAVNVLGIADTMTTEEEERIAQQFLSLVRHKRINTQTAREAALELAQRRREQHREQAQRGIE